VLKESLLLAVGEERWALVADLAMHLKAVTKMPAEVQQEPVQEVQSPGPAAEGRTRWDMATSEDGFEFEDL
jgi:hypothetical protein